MHHQSYHVHQRRQEVAALYLSGKYQSEIAQVIGISQQQVSHDLLAVQRAWLASSLRDFDAVKAQELAKLDAAEREYWAAWHRSCQPREVTLTKRIAGKDPRDEASIRRETPAGDVRFLDGVLRCIHQRCALLGVATAADTAILTDIRLQVVYAPTLQQES